MPITIHWVVEIKWVTFAFRNYIFFNVKNGNHYLITLLSRPEVQSIPPGNVVLHQPFLEIIFDAVTYYFQPQQSTAGRELPVFWPSGSKRIGHCWENTRINSGIPLLLSSSLEQQGPLVVQRHKSYNRKAVVNYDSQFYVVYKKWFLKIWISASTPWK